MCLQLNQSIQDSIISSLVRSTPLDSVLGLTHHASLMSSVLNSFQHILEREMPSIFQRTNKGARRVESNHPSTSLLLQKVTLRSTFQRSRG